MLRRSLSTTLDENSNPNPNWRQLPSAALDENEDWEDEDLEEENWEEDGVRLHGGEGAAGEPGLLDMDGNVVHPHEGRRSRTSPPLGPQAPPRRRPPSLNKREPPR